MEGTIHCYYKPFEAVSYHRVLWQEMIKSPTVAYNCIEWIKQAPLVVCGIMKAETDNGIINIPRSWNWS